MVERARASEPVRPRFESVSTTYWLSPSRPQLLPLVLLVGYNENLIR